MWTVCVESMTPETSGNYSLGWTHAGPDGFPYGHGPVCLVWWLAFSSVWSSGMLSLYIGFPARFQQTDNLFLQSLGHKGGTQTSKQTPITTKTFVWNRKENWKKKSWDQWKRKYSITSIGFSKRNLKEGFIIINSLESRNGLEEPRWASEEAELRQWRDGRVLEGI